MALLRGAKFVGFNKSSKYFNIVKTLFYKKKERIYMYIHTRMESCIKCTEQAGYGPSGSGLRGFERPFDSL